MFHGDNGAELIIIRGHCCPIKVGGDSGNEVSGFPTYLVVGRNESVCLFFLLPSNSIGGAYTRGAHSIAKLSVLFLCSRPAFSRGHVRWPPCAFPSHQNTMYVSATSNSFLLWQTLWHLTLLLDLLCFLGLIVQSVECRQCVLPLAPKLHRLIIPDGSLLLLAATPIFKVFWFRRSMFFYGQRLLHLYLSLLVTFILQ